MKLLLIDGSNLIFRAYYATENQNIMTLDDRPANAIHALIGMLDKLIKEHEPTHMFIGLDTGKSTFRHEAFPDYKGKRITIPEALRVQLNMAYELYDAMNIKYDATDLFEADDLIASYANYAKCKDCEVVIVSGDKDLLQLVDKNVTVVTPKIGFSKEVRYTPEEFMSRYDFEPTRFVEYKALVGDSSDNITGVDKVGDKTARKLLCEHESLEAIVKSAQEGNIKGKLGERLSVALPLLESNIDLVTLIEDVDLKFDLESLQFNTFVTEKFIKYIKACGFTKLITKYADDLGIKEEVVSTPISEIEHKTIFKFNKDEHTSKETFIYTRSLENNYHYGTNLGIGLSSDKGNFYLDFKKADENFIAFLQDQSIKITYDLKALMVMFNLTEVGNFVMDLKLALNVLNIYNAKREFDANVMKYGVDYIKTNEQVYLKKDKPVMPENKSELVKDIVYKARALNDIYLAVVSELEEQKLETIIYDIELPLTEVLARMEIEGIRLDEDKLNELTTEYEKMLSEYDMELKKYTDINYESPKQLNELLFNVWELPTNGLKKTKSGISTDATNLDKLLTLLTVEQAKFTDQIEFINKLLQFRKIKKIHSVYLDGLKKQLTDGYLHPIYHQLLAETGRISVTEPNIQNIPIRSDDGQVIRSLFAAPKGYKLAAIDYSQVELRIMSVLAKETQMIADFKNELDIHSETAKKILHSDEVTAKERSQAKAINFGIIYGMSSYGLANQLNISNSEAQTFIDNYFKTYPNIKNYMTDTIKFAQDNGYVKTYLGRKRFINGIDSKNRNEREAAERVAINTPVQGSAADIIKLAMVKIDDYLVNFHDDIKMVMQIHDELVFYIPEDKTDVITELVKIMETTIDLEVTLKAEGNLGDNWLEAK